MLILAALLIFIVVVAVTWTGVSIVSWWESIANESDLEATQDEQTRAEDVAELDDARATGANRAQGHDS